MEQLTEEQRESRIEALMQELKHYETYDNSERAGEVRAQLDLLGADGETPHKRAAKRAKGSKKHTEL